MTPIQDCQAGRISPQVAVARLLLAGHDTTAILTALNRTNGAATDAMRALVETRASPLDALAAEIRDTAARHDASGPPPAEGIAPIAAFFDRAVQHSPEASVALYSLGDPAILAAATAEIVAWLGIQHLLPARADILDLGCGIGRVATALAPACRSILALDVSPGMVAEATTRLAPHPNVTIRHTTGEDLDWLEPDSLDLILAIDSFPYIVQTGPSTALTHIQGAARALRPGGALCILNLSYRNDPEADRADATAWATATGLRLTHHGQRPFRLWDGTAYILSR